MIFHCGLRDGIIQTSTACVPSILLKGCAVEQLDQRRVITFFVITISPLPVAAINRQSLNTAGYLISPVLLSHTLQRWFQRFC